MKTDDPRFELIRRQFDGEATEDDLRQLEAALREDASFRADFVRYVNLDVALGAAARAATLPESGTGRIVTFPQSSARSSRHYGRWLAAAAACAALAALVAIPIHRNSPKARPDITAILASTQDATAQLSIEPPSLFPEWASPTASLLDQPRFPR